VTNYPLGYTDELIEVELSFLSSLVVVMWTKRIRTEFGYKWFYAPIHSWATPSVPEYDCLITYNFWLCNHVCAPYVRCCCWWWSGPGAKAPVALQPLGLLYTLFSRSSHCRRQMSPRPTRRETSKQRELELQWARKSSREFCLHADFHVTFRDLLHAANLRHGTAGFTSPPKEGVLGIYFSPWKIRRLRPGLNPRTWVL
jgi:hypothetical protein